MWWRRNESRAKRLLRYVHAIDAAFDDKSASEEERNDLTNCILIMHELRSTEEEMKQTGSIEACRRAKELADKTIEIYEAYIAKYDVAVPDPQN